MNRHLDRALEALQAENFQRAEREFERAIREIRKQSDRFGLFFALGQQGFLYEQMGETDKAIAVYREAVKAGTDIPATYSGLISLLIERGEYTDAFNIADSWQKHGGQHIHDPAHRIFIGQGSSLIRKKEFDKALDLLIRTSEFFSLNEYPQEYWNIQGLIGIAHEKAGKIDQAMEVFREAIKEGSNDRQTYTRLIMFLEKNKRYDEALKIINVGLNIQNDASWEVDLLKRKNRISQKAGKITKEAAKAVIPEFTIRRGEGYVSLVNQIKCSPQINSLIVIKNRAYGTSGGKKPRLRAWDITSGELVHESILTETASKIYSTDNGFLTISESGRIGDGTSTIRFYGIDANELNVQHLDDKISEIAISEDLAFVGCRDGRLYAFSCSGSKLWSYALEQDNDDDVYTKPCPYYVRAGARAVVFSSFSDLYAINDQGHLLWKWSTPAFKESTRAGSFTVTMSTGPSSIRDLEITKDGSRVFVTANDTLYQIVVGKSATKKKFKDKYLGSVYTNTDGSRYAIQIEKSIYLFDGSKRSGIISAGYGSRLKYGNRVIVWEDKHLTVADYRGKVHSQIEFTKRLSNVVEVGKSRLVVCAGHLIVLETKSLPRAEKSNHPQPKRGQKSEVVRNERTHEEGISLCWIEGEKVTSGRGKVKYLGKDGNELFIEQLALEHYFNLGYEGLWSENDYWWALMALLFWDVLYAKIPGVYSDLAGKFPSKMQDMPRDLFHKEFYPRRKKLIEGRVQTLGKDTLLGLAKGSISSEIRRSYSSHRGKPCRILDWDKFSSAEPFEIAGTMLSKDQLVGIMTRLLLDFNNNRRGMPDLFLFNSEQVKFVEVKSEREKIQETQIAWLKYLGVQLGIDVEICRVRVSKWLKTIY